MLRSAWRLSRWAAALYGTAQRAGFPPWPGLSADGSAVEGREWAWRLFLASAGRLDLVHAQRALAHLTTQPTAGDGGATERRTP